ncbi:hypothetical protein EMCG_01937 [[Emmonsia] crescens]|uniref:Cation/H+ exchanger transmembrane domain-containing protein n=1 Tax=[Emmonsia] crescens TaxID=73230 RepID=A0A0G2I039_9EURO|nr:hypothetical protein EMCG_01937 [Emmonsia crescens UAMH 3008]
MPTTEQKTALPYHEPPILTLLTHSSFLLLLNIVNHLLDYSIYCGLLGQLFIGVAWGLPGAQLLDIKTQEVVGALGYIGLILVVYEGGLSTSPPSLLANLPLSTAVALTGIALPMALSFAVLPALLPTTTPLQAFAAGAALCSTSLGTTFTVLNASGLVKTRLGTVLSCAAMMDDVVGLVLVKVIADLGGGRGRGTKGGGSEIDAVVVVRPVVVSVGAVVVVVGGCWGGKGVEGLIKRVGSMGSFLGALRIGSSHVVFVVHTAVLIGFVTVAVYAGTSGLFAAYMAGAVISWWDCVSLPFNMERGEDSGGGDGDGEEEGNTNRHGSLQGGVQQPSSKQADTEGCRAASSGGERSEGASMQTVDRRSGSSDSHADRITGLEIYERYYSPVVERILKPFFFASIGFAIPMKDLFKSPIIWRGIVYTILMTLGKLLTGIWLVRFDFGIPLTPALSKRLHSSSAFSPWLSKLWCVWMPQKEDEKKSTTATDEQHIRNNRKNDITDHDNDSHATTNATGTRLHRPQQEEQQQQHPTITRWSPSKWPRPRSLYPASILGMAMVARGEIGFLISSLGESSGVFSPAETSSSSSGVNNNEGKHLAAASDIYLVITWAIMMCTIVGPVSVGTLVKRVKRLQEAHKIGGSGDDPLGIWGLL